MVEFSPDCSFGVLTLPHEDSLEQAHLWSQWLAAYPDCTPIEGGYRNHAFTALVEKQRIAQARSGAADPEGTHGGPRLGAGPGGYGRVLGESIQRPSSLGPGRPAAQCGRLPMGDRLLDQARPAA